jgi:drug/metabolite transporter (DMT)-like permease
VSEAPRPSALRLAAAFFAIYVIWGSTYLAIRIGIETLPPILMAGIRHLLAGVVLYVWARTRLRAASPTGGEWRRAAVLGSLMLVLANGTTTWAEQFVPSGLTALIVCTSALWLVLLNWLWLGGDRPSGRVVTGLLAGFLGVAILVVPGRLAGGERVNLVGAAALTMSALSWAVGSLHAIRLPRPRIPALALGMQMLAAGAVLVTIALATGDGGRLFAGQVSARSIAALLYLTVFGSLVAYSAYFWLLRATTPARISTISYVNPLVAVMLGWASGDDPATARTAAAAAVILLSVVLITGLPSRARG